MTWQRGDILIETRASTRGRRTTREVKVVSRNAAYAETLVHPLGNETAQSWVEDVDLAIPEVDNG
jgi:hypothetical protein